MVAFLETIRFDRLSESLDERKPIYYGNSKELIVQDPSPSVTQHLNNCTAKVLKILFHKRE